MLDLEQVRVIGLIKSRAMRMELSGGCLFVLFRGYRLFEFDFFCRGRVMITVDVSRDCETQFAVDLCVIDGEFLDRLLGISLDVRTCLSGYANENFVTFVRELLK